MIEAYRVGFETLDAHKLQSIWDPDYPTIYCPIELDRPRLGNAEIDDYYERVTRHVGGVRTMRVDDVTIDSFSDSAYAFFTFHFESSTHESDEPFVVDGRTTFVLRYTVNGWKGIHYHESRPPLPG